jgi:hypothetical protein
MDSTEQEQALTGLERRVRYLQLGQTTSDDGEEMDTSVSPGLGADDDVEDIAVVAEDIDVDYADDKMTTHPEPSPSTSENLEQGPGLRAKRRFQGLEADLRGLQPGSIFSRPSSSNGFGANMAHKHSHKDDQASLEIQSESRSYQSKDDQGVEVMHKHNDHDHDDDDRGDLVLFGPTSHPRRSVFTFSLTESTETDQGFSNPFAGLYKHPSLVLDLGNGLDMGEALHPSLLFSSTTLPGSSFRRRSRRSVAPGEVVA